MWGPNITSAQISPSTVEVNGSYMVTVVVTLEQLKISEAQAMTMDQIQQVPLDYMRERS